MAGVRAGRFRPADRSG